VINYFKTRMFTRHTKVLSLVHAHKIPFSVHNPIMYSVNDVFIGQNINE